MAKKYKYLNDKPFLKEIDNLRLRHQYAKIIVLDFESEKPIEDITGRVSSGNISISGDSCVRRTANLTFVIDDPGNYNLFNVNNIISINKKISLEIGVENTTDKYSDYPIIWFPQGIYIITQPSISYSTSGLTVSLQLKDKMCLLNGDCGGVFPAQTTLSEIDDMDATGASVVTYPTIYQIIQELVNHFGGEQLSKIIINDIGTTTYQIMKSVASNPIYAFPTAEGETGADVASYTFETTAPSSGNYLTFKYGEPVAYAPTEFTYPGELIVNAGSTVTAALDTIKNTLGGNFEYFYDLEGNFVFQEIKNYLNTSQSTIINKIINSDTTGEAATEAYRVARQSGKSVYDFRDTSLIISYSLNPNYLNIKNDITVWGTRQTTGGAKYPIRYRLVIDHRPSLFNDDGSPISFENVFVYKSNYNGDDNLIKASIPIKLPVSNIDDAGIGSPNTVYWIVVNKDTIDTNIKIIRERYKSTIENCEKAIVNAKNDLSKYFNDSNIQLSDDLENLESNLYLMIGTVSYIGYNSENKEIIKEVMNLEDEYPDGTKEDTINNNTDIVAAYLTPIGLDDNEIIEKIKELSKAWVTKERDLYDVIAEENAEINHEKYEKGNNRYYVWDMDNIDYVEINDNGEICYNYVPKDWRTLLYLQGAAADPYGTDSNDYYVELKNEWPKLYDLRPRLEAGRTYNSNDKLYMNKSGHGQEFWQEVIEDPTTMDYYLDFIDDDAVAYEFNVNTIGRRQKVIEDDDANCIFEPQKFCNTTLIRAPYAGDGATKYKREEELKKSYIDQCLTEGRSYSVIQHGIYDALIMSNVYNSCYEIIRSALQEYTDYNETLQISCVPIFYLEPNTRITVENTNLNISGDYMIKSMSLPLGNGTMSIQANKIIEKL